MLRFYGTAKNKAEYRSTKSFQLELEVNIERPKLTRSAFGRLKEILKADEAVTQVQQTGKMKYSLYGFNEHQNIFTSLSCRN